MAKNEETIKSGFGTASLVLGIIAICTSFIPIINNLSFVLGILAVIFGIISLTKKASKGVAIAGVIISILAMIITINAQKTLGDAINTAVNEFNNDMDTVSGENTEEVLANNVDVILGTFSVTTGSYGISDTKLPVTVTNKSPETKSFSIQIEAVDSNGNRINTDYIYANNLGTGQSQDFKVFEYVSDDNLTTMKSATFNIVEVSMY